MWWSLHKNPKSMEFRVSRLMKTCVYWEGDSPNYMGKKLLCSGSSQVSPVSLHLPVYLHPSSHPLLHNNKLLSVSRRFPEVLWAVLANNQIQRGRGCGNPQFVAKLKVAGNLGLTACDWHLKWGQPQIPLTCGIWCYLLKDSVRIELTCGRPSWSPNCRPNCRIGKHP